MPESLFNKVVSRKDSNSLQLTAVSENDPGQLLLEDSNSLQLTAISENIPEQLLLHFQ